ncbi:MAG TPA: selenide, water dikinase SelD [Ignavibacteriales bacterium]|nr:selenide, water dikinase SelD [Ignavibacteriales bacterium]
MKFSTGNPHEIRLTEYTSGLGCACKMRPQVLEEVLKSIPRPVDKNVLVGIDTSDDAAVYRICQNEAVVQTVDFFTPVVDDPFSFGAIAAANSLSDIYAMGAKPLFALSIAGFPISRLPVGVLKEIISGANAAAYEAGIPIIGGHTIDDTEPKFGLVVTGIIDPERVVRNSSMKSGDVLILTKPLGTGILSSALKMGLLDDNLKGILGTQMKKLNKSASEAMMEIGVNACTDVTGFGLLGHLLEMVKASGYCVTLEKKSVMLLPRVLEFVLQGAVPGGSKNNMIFTSPFIEYGSDVTETDKILLNDAQTSGGLLISVEEEKMNALLNRLDENGVDASIIGIVTAEAGSKIRVPSIPFNL